MYFVAGGLHVPQYMFWFMLHNHYNLLCNKSKLKTEVKIKSKEILQGLGLVQAALTEGSFSNFKNTIASSWLKIWWPIKISFLGPPKWEKSNSSGACAEQTMLVVRPQVVHHPAV